MSSDREKKRAWQALLSGAKGCKVAAERAKRNTRSTFLKQKISRYIDDVEKDISTYQRNVDNFDKGFSSPMPATTRYYCNIPQDRTDGRLSLKNKMKEDGSLNLKLKSPKDWTKAELQDAMKQREAASSQQKQEMMQKEREWFDHYYGTQPVQFDETGKMVQPAPRLSIPNEPRPIQTKDGRHLEDAINDVIDRLPIEGPVAPEQPTPEKPPFEGFRPLPATSEGDVVKGMQSGLNILSAGQNNSPLPGMSKTPKLKEDGVIGPKTSFALKKALVDNGTSKVSEALALGQFKETVKKAKKEGPKNLAEELGAAFDPLLGNKTAEQNPTSPVGLALQDTLNDYGAGLKDDGIIGPKTQSAFNDIVKTKDEDELVYQFADNLGFDI